MVAAATMKSPRKIGAMKNPRKSMIGTPTNLLTGTPKRVLAKNFSLNR
jgi:hypothetical protein